MENGVARNFQAKKRSIDSHPRCNTIDKPIVANSHDLAQQALDLTYRTNEPYHTPVVGTKTHNSSAQDQQDDLRANATDSGLHELEVDQKAQDEKAKRPVVQKAAQARLNTGRFGVLCSDDDEEDSDSQTGSNASEEGPVEDMRLELGNKKVPTPGNSPGNKWEVVRKEEGKKAPKNVWKKLQLEKNMQPVDALHSNHAHVLKSAVSKSPSSAQTKPQTSDKLPPTAWLWHSTAQSQVDGGAHWPQTMPQSPQRVPPSMPKAQRETSPHLRENSPQRTEDLKAKIRQTIESIPSKPSPKNASNSHRIWKTAQNAQQGDQYESADKPPSRPGTSASPFSRTSSRSTPSSPSKMASTPAIHGHSASPSFSGSVDEMARTKVDSWADDV